MIRVGKVLFRVEMGVGGEGEERKREGGKRGRIGEGGRGVG